VSPIASAILAAGGRGGPAIVAFLTAGYPGKNAFLAQLRAAAASADVVEIGLPFTDPMADGLTIQRASRIALEQGVSLRWLLGALAALRGEFRAPLLLMSYLNPLLAFGIDELPSAASSAGISGFIVPDLPLEESADLRRALNRQGLSLVQFVAPTTPAGRASRLAAASEGFLYALTAAGITGQNAALPEPTLDYLARLRRVAQVPVCAGFGIRGRRQVERLAPHVDGVIVGSALLEALEQGADLSAWIRDLRPASMRG
jgi:tryptophan synthase alpha chain